jgi:non-heme chloroperoxidase
MAKEVGMPEEIRTRDGARLFHRDWGAGRAIVFVAGWSMPSDAWARQMQPLAARGMRCVAHDRRAHGRSDDPGRGFDFDTLSDDLAAVMEALDLHDAVLVGHSMGCGEILRYLTRHGARRVGRVVLVATTTPRLMRAADNPHGVPAEAFAALRAAIAEDFPAWVGANLDAFVAPETSAGTRGWLRGLALGTSLQALVELSRANAEADFRAELRGVPVPALVIHGDADASAPLDLCGRPTAELLPAAWLQVYPGAPHGLFATHAARLAADIAEFAAAA